MPSTPPRTEWLAARRVAPFTVTEPVPHRPDLLLVLDRSSGRVVKAEPFEKPPSTTELAERIAALLPRGRRRVDLAVEDEALARALRSWAPLGTTIETRALPEIDLLMESLEASTRVAEAPWGFDDSATRDDLIAFYVAGRQFATAQHWKRIEDGQCLLFEVPDLGWRAGCASVMGSAGETFGLQVSASLDDHLAWVRHAASGVPFDRGPGRPLLALYFDLVRDLPGGRAQAAHARQHGHPARGKARIPHAIRLDANGVPNQPTGSDCRLLTVLMAGLNSFVKHHGDLFDAPPDKQIRMSATIRTPTASFPIVITAPPDPGRLPWRWGEESSIEGIRAETIGLHVEPYEQARREQGATDAEAHADAALAAELLSCSSVPDARPSAWSPDELAEFLLDYYPAHGAAIGEEIEAVPARIERFFAWLESSDRVVVGALAPALRRLAQCRAEFVARASDPRRYDMAKVVAIGARKAGVDVTDLEALAEFIREEAARQARPPGPGLKKWSWDGNGAPPDLAGPCPCGSGKRHKKCCLPR